MNIHITLFRLYFSSISVFVLFISVFFTHDAAALTPSSKEKWVEIVEARDTRDMKTALYALEKYADPELLPILTALLNDKKYLNNLSNSEKIEILISSIRTIGEIQSPQALDIIVSFLDHEAYLVRIIALENIGKYQNDSTYPVLLNSLNDSNRYIRAAAIKSLGDIKKYESISILLAIAIDKKESTSIRNTAEKSIAAHHKKDIYPLIEQWLVDENHSKRYVAVDVLTTIRDESIIPLLAIALKDESANIRRAATFGLGKADSKKAMPLLIKALQEENRHVCMGASSNLSSYKKFNAYKPLVKALRHKSAIVRLCGAAGLELMVDSRSAKALQNALAKDKDPRVRFYSAQALGRMKSSSAIDTLVNALSDDDEKVRKQVKKALRQFDDPKAVAALRELSKEDS